MSKGLYSDPYQILQKDGDSMKTSTTVAQDLGTWQEEQALDAACCRLLANKVILAHVLQGCVPEYSRCSIPELLPCLESTPEICSVPVDQDVLDPGRIRGENTADKSITEGNVNFDILLSARTPNGRESRQIFINVESQNDWNPGYPGLLLLWAAPFPAERNRLPEFRLPETPKGLFPLDLSGPSKVQTEHPDIVPHDGRKFGGQRQI